MGLMNVALEVLGARDVRELNRSCASPEQFQKLRSFLQNVLVIAGTGGQSTKETKKLCADAKEAGATHALVLTPGVWPNQMSKDRILKFHRDVCRSPFVWTWVSRSGPDRSRTHPPSPP